MAVQTASANLTKAEQFVIFSEYEQLGGAALSIQLGHSIVTINQWAEKLGVRKAPAVSQPSSPPKSPSFPTPTMTMAESLEKASTPAAGTQASLLVDPPKISNASSEDGAVWTEDEIKLVTECARSCKSVNSLVLGARHLFNAAKPASDIIDEVFWMRQRLLNTNSLHAAVPRANRIWNYQTHYIIATKAQNTCTLKDITDWLNERYPDTPFTMGAVASQLSWLGYSTLNKGVEAADRRFVFKRKSANSRIAMQQQLATSNAK